MLHVIRFPLQFAGSAIVCCLRYEKVRTVYLTDLDI